MSHPSNLLADGISALAILGTILGYLPYMAAVAGLLWYLIQIKESHTVQHWWNNRKLVRRAKKVARLRAREKVILAELEALESVRAAKHAAIEHVETAKVEAAKLVVQEETQRTEDSAS